MKLILLKLLLMWLKGGVARYGKLEEMIGQKNDELGITNYECMRHLNVSRSMEKPCREFSSPGISHIRNS